MRDLKTIVRFGAVAAALCLAASPALAIVNPVVDFGSGYAFEGNRLVGDQTSDAGDVMTIVGFVADFNDPFDDLDANDPTKQYTYVYRELVSAGTVVSGGGSFIFYDTDYSGGILEVYCDDVATGTAADYANPSTFADGDMILQADLMAFHIATKSFNCSGNQNADLSFTGGSLFNRVSTAGVGWDGIITGLFSVCASVVPDDLEALGYFGLSDTKIDVDCPVPVTPSTWGGIKRQY